jgi:adenylate cyclase
MVRSRNLPARELLTLLANQSPIKRMLPKQLRQGIWEWRGVLFAAPTVAGTISLLHLTGLLQSPGWVVLDQFLRWRPTEAPESRILIVGIDEDDLKRVGKWPIPDQVLAQALQNIKAQKPRAIGLDIYRDLPVEPGHNNLVTVFKSTPYLIGIEKIVGNNRGGSIAPSPVLSKKGQIASNDVIVDGDGKIRRGLLYLNPPARKPIAGLALRLAMIYLQGEGITPEAAENGNLKLGKTVFKPFEADDGAYAGGYQILLNYRKPKAGFPTVSLSDVLENRVPKERVRDRIVMIGSTAESLNDYFYTPFSNELSDKVTRTAGVEIQANITSQILMAALQGRPLLRIWPDFLEHGWIFLWSSIGAILAWTLPNWKWTAGSLIVASGGLFVGCYLVFLGGWWIPVIPPIITLGVSALAVTVYIAQKEKYERQMALTLFRRYVSPQIANAIWSDRDRFMKEGRLKGQRLTATVMFTDLKNFSHLSNKLEPEAFLDWLNEYMEAMSQAVLANGGVVDKFMGDAVMAVFGVPIARTTEEAIANDAKAAVKCATEMAAALEALNQRWLEQGRPTAAMRVGIATGTVVAGSLGGIERLEYTTIGDCVNLAARLESFDKSFNSGTCRIFINKRTYQHIQSDFPTQLIGSVQLRGRQRLTTIYQVLLD